MAEVNFTPQAYCKIILHAAKYPHCAINGLLLAEPRNKNEGKSNDLRIVDAIPLFHICLHVSPMAEVALTLVDQLATRKGLVLAGYYLANENLNDLSTDKPAHRTADKIAENFPGALLVVIDNREMTLGMTTHPFRVSQSIDGKWRLKDKLNVNYEGGVALTDTIYSLLKSEEYRNLVDFDNHLDNIALDWENLQLNDTIEDVMEENRK